MNLRSVALALVVLSSVVHSCKKDAVAPNSEEEQEAPGTNLGIAVLDSISLAIDAEGELLVYNGANMNFDSLVVVQKDTFRIEPTDGNLILGKPYTISLENRTYTLYRTEIPLVVLETDGVEIPDEPKIGGNITIMHDGDEPFESLMGIERRGGLSQTFPKKSYSMELWDDVNGDDDRKESLLGMREDDDWILDGLWNEPLRIRDFTSHDIWLKMGRYHYRDKEPETTLGIKRKYCEVFLNGNYRGIYYLSEKVDRKQLNLKDYDDGLHGELYKGDAHGHGVNFTGVEDFSNSSETWSGYEAKYPDDFGELDWANLHDLVSFVVNSDVAMFNGEIETRIDLENAVDYFIFMNVIFAADNNGKNLHTARYDTGTPFFFVPWDLDATYGNDWFGERFWPETEIILTNGLYDRLLLNTAFKTELRSRWNALKVSVLQHTKLLELLNSNYMYLKGNGAYQREGLYESLPQNYSDTEIDFMATWLEIRLAFFENYVNGL